MHSCTFYFTTFIKTGSPRTAHSAATGGIHMLRKSTSAVRMEQIVVQLRSLPCRLHCYLRLRPPAVCPRRCVTPSPARLPFAIRHPLRRTVGWQWNQKIPGVSEYYAPADHPDRAGVGQRHPHASPTANPSPHTNRVVTRHGQLPYSWSRFA